MCRGLWVPTSGWTPFGLLTSSRISWYLVIQWCFRQHLPFLQGSWENPLLDYPSGSAHPILLQPSLLSSCSSAPFSPLNFSLSFSHSKTRRKIVWTNFSYFHSYSINAKPPSPWRETWPAAVASTGRCSYFLAHKTFLKLFAHKPFLHCSDRSEKLSGSGISVFVKAA